MSSAEEQDNWLADAMANPLAEVRQLKAIDSSLKAHFLMRMRLRINSYTLLQLAIVARIFCRVQFELKFTDFQLFLVALDFHECDTHSHRFTNPSFCNRERSCQFRDERLDESLNSHGRNFF
jgi:hypothetical protein